MKEKDQLSCFEKQRKFIADIFDEAIKKARQKERKFISIF